MSNSLHTDDFEEYLQDKVSNHRMYPADQIWRNIQKEIHGEGKWPALTYISIFIITALSISTLMVKPEDRLHKNIAVYPVQANSEEVQPKQTNASEAAPVQYAYADRITQQTLQTVSEVITEHAIANHSSLPALSSEAFAIFQNKETIADTKELATNDAVVKTPAKAEALQASVALKDEKAAEIFVQHNQVKPASRYFSTLGLLKLSDLKKPVNDPTALYSQDEIWRNYPLLSTKDLIKKKLSKFSFQFYITPSVSFRRLNDANGKTANSYTAIPRNTDYQVDIKQVVEHHAAMGAEVGFALGYKLTPSLTVKGGLQFNMRQYSIKAYTLPGSGSALYGGVAMENVNGAAGANGERIDNSSYYTSADRSSVSSQTTLLYNRYYEVAAPIGIEWRLLSSDNNKLSFNVAAALQPTYTFDKEPFVITTDYKNYTDGASIMRNWNLNSNIEAFISYKLGSFQWQLGPQFRYQHFSTYSNAYPIREHLLDYGIKLGFTKPID